LIVVDSSALIAISFAEPEMERCSDAIAAAGELMMSAATVTETLIVAARRGGLEQTKNFLDGYGIDVIPLDERRARAAAAAYHVWGKSFHRAKLNYGDCFAYALAKEFRCALLYIGNDFAQTDVISALT
jgi:ribonuclease VapC